MLVKTLLNQIERFKGFVFGKVSIRKGWLRKLTLVVEILPRKGSRPECSVCGRKRPTYDTSRNAREVDYIPLWSYRVVFRYFPRRVNCPWDGIQVEGFPWTDGKERMTHSYKIFLARWARRLSWNEVATDLETSWGCVFRAVKAVVDYGLVHRSLDGVTQIGVDEIAVFAGQKYLTMVYQLDAGARRLLWCGPERRLKTLLRFFRMFGKERSAKLKYVCSDMWGPYLKVIAKKAPQALNILDRFHIMKKFGEAIDEIRRGEVVKFKAEGQKNLLHNGRWALLKRPENLTEKQTVRLAELVKLNLATVRAYLLKEDFQRFWTFTNTALASWFLDTWCTRTMRSRLEPMKKVPRMLRRHKTMILNWFAAEGALSSGAVEGLNLKAKLAMRKAYGSSP
jgi:transposase